MTFEILKQIFYGYDPDEAKKTGGVMMASIFKIVFRSGAFVAAVFFIHSTTLPGQEEVPLISRRVFFGNPDRASPQLSPDGTQLAFLAPDEGVLNVWVGSVDDPTSAKPVTHDRLRGIRIYFWAYTNRHIIYLQDKNGDENWRVYSVDLRSGQVMDLTPVEGVQARIQQVSEKFPAEILIGLNDRNPQFHDLYRVNILSGSKRLIQENPGFLDFLTDDYYRVRFAFRLTPDGGNEVLKPTEEGKWEPFMTISQEDLLTTQLIRFDKSNRVLYMTDSRGRNTAALASIDLRTGEEEIIAEDPRADISDVIAHPAEKNMEAVAFTYDRKEWKILDPALREDFAYLSTISKDDLNITSQSLDDRKWIVTFTVDNGPIRYYVYDRDLKEAKFLFTNRKALEGLPLAKMHPVVIRSRDNLNLVSYYTLPVWSDADGNGKPEKRLPLVLTVHGGPWWRDNWGYNPWHQWFSNRGYAVMSVNFRGSTGFGKKFINAGDKEWGGKMHDDLIDAVNWAVEQGIADPKHIAIMGGSYGGYATLVGMTFTPDDFACGVDIVGPSNLVTFMNAIPPYWKPLLDLFTSRVGDHRTEEGRAFLLARSPLTYVDRIQKPLLIGHGANDPRVKQAESEQIVKAMQGKNIPVTYVLYPDEGHGFARPQNNLSFYAITDVFLAKCLGGRYEPIGDDLTGSSLLVPAGADLIPGLPRALKALSAPTKILPALP